jgi:hypothetical protein
MSDFDVKEENFVSGRDEDSPSQHRTERFSAPMSRDRQKHWPCILCVLYSLLLIIRLKAHVFLV